MARVFMMSCLGQDLLTSVKHKCEATGPGFQTKGRCKSEVRSCRQTRAVLLVSFPAQARPRVNATVSKDWKNDLSPSVPEICSREVSLSLKNSKKKCSYPCSKTERRRCILQSESSGDQGSQAPRASAGENGEDAGLREKPQTGDTSTCGARNGGDPRGPYAFSKNCSPRARNKGHFPSLPLHETPTRRCLRHRRANTCCSSLFLDL